MTQETQKKKRQNREYVVELEEPTNHRLAYTLGALGGLALAAWLTRGVERGMEALAGRGAATRSRGANDGAPARFRPGRLRREPRDQDELLLMEDTVLDAFLGDALLRDRGIDVGAISPGIVELSGAVFTRGEAAHAVAVAQGVEGVRTVVNRMEVDDGRGHSSSPDAEDDVRTSGSEWTGHSSGMGSRRQGRDSDPFHRDDSHRQREMALERADRAQFADEGYHSRPRVGERDEVQPANRTHFRDDELDNQTPHARHRP